VRGAGTGFCFGTGFCLGVGFGFGAEEPGAAVAALGLAFDLGAAAFARFGAFAPAFAGVFLEAIGSPPPCVGAIR
jgi:hypothetical protein